MAAAKSRTSDQSISACSTPSHHQNPSSLISHSSTSTYTADYSNLPLNPPFNPPFLAPLAPNGMLLPKPDEFSSDLIPNPPAMLPAHHNIAIVNRFLSMMEEETMDNGGQMTLEDFLNGSGTMEKVGVGAVAGFPGAGAIVACEGGNVGFRNRGEVVKRRRDDAVARERDRAGAQKQKRMIKNRESAARSRERKQAYQASLEAQILKLQSEKEKLLEQMKRRNEATLDALKIKCFAVEPRGVTVESLRGVPVESLRGVPEEETRDPPPPETRPPRPKLPRRRSTGNFKYLSF